MSPDDPRHGSHRGYVLGCRETCCTRAQTRYMKLYRLGRQPKLIDPTGTIRRIEALYALGWTSAAIGEHCGRGREWARMISRSEAVTTTTAALVASAYDALCMRLPAGGYVERSRRHAARMGWAPPMAWDDDTIDDPDARPRGVRDEPCEYVDPVVVERILAGDYRLHATQPERLAVIACWTLSRNELERRTGWNVSRDLRETRLEEAS